VLPAATFTEGPASGRALGQESLGQSLPFAQQPVQGVSAILLLDDDRFLALVDNGYGTLENSADFNLRVYRMKAWPRTAAGGEGAIEVEGFFELSDPDDHIPFVVVNELVGDRVLTGADFDLESMQQAPDGTLWFGDEFGPSLLHCDHQGRVLEPPIRVPAFGSDGHLHSAQDPMLERTAALRVMNAVGQHAIGFGQSQRPKVSPSHLLVADGDLSTTHRARRVALPGLPRGSSELFDVASLHTAGYAVIPWTVNEPERMRALLNIGVDGIITDRPDLLMTEVRGFDADGDGKPGDLMTPEGLVDRSRFDLQGHRGARNLRPENTLPAMEAALDNLATTLELDIAVTADAIPVVSHDPTLRRGACRSTTDGAATRSIKDLSLADLQAGFVCDKTSRGRPDQVNDRALSPVSVRFAEKVGLADAYTIPTLDQLYEFVEFYAGYYAAKSETDDAAQRAQVARGVHFNIELKTSPADPGDTVPIEQFLARTAEVILARKAETRSNLQSFDFRVLLLAQEKYPSIPTAYLFGDSPLALGGDGANLDGAQWRAGLEWPYRASGTAQVGQSAGFEGLALSPDGRRLYAMLEKPLAGARDRKAFIFVYDLEREVFLPTRHAYPLDERAASIGDFQLITEDLGLVIERDDAEGRMDAFKRVYAFSLRSPATTKRLVADLLQLRDPDGVTQPVDGDVGLGDPFGLPFFTIESLVVRGPRRIVVATDNNFPLHAGRHREPPRPDDTEWVLIELEEPLVREKTRSRGKRRR
jgi:glycerophosphoryl diester phosphodiesterase